MRLTCFKHFQAEQWEKKGRWLFRVYRGLYCLVGDKNEALLQGSLDCGFKPLVEGNAPTTWNSNNNRMVHQTWRCLTIRPQNEGKLSLMPDLSEWPKFASLHHQSPSNPQSTTGGATPPPHPPCRCQHVFFLIFTWTARFVVWFYQLHFHHNHVNPMAPWIGMRGRTD